MDIDLKKVTIRKGANKAHRAYIVTRPGVKPSLMFACHCPGTQAGRALHGQRVICEGWEAATCKI
jgi:hypothetical protein